MAGLTHATKAAARPVVNVSTAGIGAPVVSTIEDVLSVVLSVLAIFAPILIVVALVLLAWLMFVIWRRWVAWRRRRAEAQVSVVPEYRGIGTWEDPPFSAAA